jgi:hypothetical protein
VIQSLINKLSSIRQTQLPSSQLTKEMVPILKHQDSQRHAGLKSAKKVTLSDLRTTKFRKSGKNGYVSNGEDEDMPYISDN